MKLDTALLRERVGKGKEVHLSYYVDGDLYYKCDDGFEFIDPKCDTTNTQGNTPTFMRDDKAIYFMRWIRKAMEGG